MSIDLEKYKDFVAAVTSDASNHVDEFQQRIQSLGTDHPEINLSLLITAGIGLAAECGEFCEVPKKILFQGKSLDPDAVYHMKRELGDIIWYWVNACRALSLDPNDVILENVRKLEARYPGGKFDPYHSENRKSDDI